MLLDLLQIADSAFPTGAYVHSGGLEWLAQRGPLDLDALLRLRLRESLGRLELVFVYGAHRTEPDDSAALASLDRRLQAMLLPRETRAASSQVGRRLLSTAADLFDDRRLRELHRVAPHCHQAVAFGVVARVLGVPARTAAEVYAFQAVRGQVSAAQRLLRLGQFEAQRLLHRLKPAVAGAAAEAERLPLEQAGAFAPLLDVAAMGHERAPVRLFVS
jgi:urease accessory protein